MHVHTNYSYKRIDSKKVTYKEKNMMKKVVIFNILFGFQING